MNTFLMCWLLIISSITVEAQNKANQSYIHGRVIGVDQLGKQDTLNKAVIRFPKYKIGVYSDEVGRYMFFIPDSLLNKKVIMEYKYVGYNPYCKKIHLKKLPIEINVILKPRLTKITMP